MSAVQVFFKTLWKTDKLQSALRSFQQYFTNITVASAPIHAFL